jgi:hypothetical protein
VERALTHSGHRWVSGASEATATGAPRLSSSTVSSPFPTCICHGCNGAPTLTSREVAVAVAAAAAAAAAAAWHVRDVPAHHTGRGCVSPSARGRGLSWLPPRAAPAQRNSGCLPHRDTPAGSCCARPRPRRHQQHVHCRHRRHCYCRCCLCRSVLLLVLVLVEGGQIYPAR